jgi:hypothetical protein
MSAAGRALVVPMGKSTAMMSSGDEARRRAMFLKIAVNCGEGKCPASGYLQESVRDKITSSAENRTLKCVLSSSLFI